VVQPSPYVYAILLLWIPISAMIFASVPTVRAVVYVTLGGTLILPELVAIDPPILPAIDKHGLSILCALGGLMLTARKRVAAAKPLGWWDLPFMVLLVGNIGTAMTNPDSFIYGGHMSWTGTPFPTVVLPGITLREAFPLTMSDVVYLWGPYFIARASFRSRADISELLRALVVSGAIYAVLMTVEIIMSPQMHRWTYGYHATSFSHAVRGSGFKPNVYLAGGLAAAMYGFVVVMGAAAAHRGKVRTGAIPALGTLAVMLLVLLMSRNVGVVVYLAFAVPCALLLSGRLQGTIAKVLLVLFLVFPYARATGAAPTDDLVQMAAKYDAARADSLRFRFDNEDQLMERALERPWFGWGSYGRNRIFDEFSGKDISVTDGEWIIHLGTRGVVGYCGWALIFVLPLLAATRAMKRGMPRADQVLLGTLALALGVHVVDLLPNASFNRIIYLVAGAVAGLSAAATAAHRRGVQRGPVALDPAPRAPG
jgi:hypothetical protein